jgi:guanylate kinase
MNLLTLSGQTCSGKNYLAEQIERVGNNTGRPYKKMVTTTTRKPRPNEIDGIDYHFINKDDFNPSDYLEYTTYLGEYYGLTKKEIINAVNMSATPYLIITPDGVKQYKSESVLAKLTEIGIDKVVSIWLNAPTDILIGRLAARAVQEIESAYSYGAKCESVKTAIRRSINFENELAIYLQNKDCFDYRIPITTDIAQDGASVMAHSVMSFVEM